MDERFVPVKTLFDFSVSEGLLLLSLTATGLSRSF